MNMGKGERAVYSAQAQTNDFSEIRTGWRLLLSAMLGTGLGFPPVPFYTIGIFAPIFAKEFGWSFASIFGGLVVMTVGLLFGGPFVGYLVDRYGARKVAAISLSGLGISYMTLALSSGSIIQYYVSWVAMTLAGLGATSISFTRAVNAAFVSRRGLALGITLAGIGLFAMFVKPFAAWLVNIAGWRSAIVAIGLLPLMVGAPAILWGFPKAQAGSVSKNEIVQQESVNGLTVRESIRTRAFWIMVIAFVSIAFATTGPFPNMENILRSVHVHAEDIVALTSLIGVTIVVGRLTAGWLMDRIWAPLLGVIVLTGASLGSWILSQQVLSNQEAMFAIVLLGLTAGAEVDLLSYLVTRYFGVRHYGVIYGTLYGVFAAGGGFGPTMFGYAYDRGGSYSQILLLCALLFLIAACLLTALGRYPDFVGEKSVEGS